MIDDDFESVIRRMFESIMGTLNTFPEGSASFDYFTDSTVNERENESGSQNQSEPDVERVDLENEVLFIVNLGFIDGEYSVKVDEKSLIITYGLENKQTRVDLDFDVDINDSTVSSRNGVLEVSLKKAGKDDSGLRNGYLRID